MKMRKYSLMLGACFLLGQGMLCAADDVVAPSSDVVATMSAPKEAEPSDWKPVAAAEGAQPIKAVLMDKGAGNDAIVIKMVSVCDANNVWCVANDGTKDGVYQLTQKGLELKFDGVFVAAGKEIVTAINDQKEVFVLKGGKGSDWEKIEGLKLSKVSRPT
ncbi:hypothetical protein FJ364_03635, partial [Candidatus Dependentiae bacterium]|nr:hypothetical protein [Candidatus Dependentiae bacterium]